MSGGLDILIGPGYRVERPSPTTGPSESIAVSSAAEPADWIVA